MYKRDFIAKLMPPKSARRYRANESVLVCWRILASRNGSRFALGRDAELNAVSAIPNCPHVSLIDVLQSQPGGGGGDQ
jgi:hypothetical protein